MVGSSGYEMDEAGLRIWLVWDELEEIPISAHRSEEGAARRARKRNNKRAHEYGEKTSKDFVISILEVEE